MDKNTDASEGASNPMERKMKCKKCKVEFQAKLIRFTKTVEYCTNDINDVRTWKETKTIERPQYTKCELCRNMQKAMNFLNKKMVSEI